MVKTTPTGLQQRYIKSFREASELIIRAYVKRGELIVVLKDLYNILGATTPSEQNGVQWAVQDCKDLGLINSIDGIRGAYSVS